MKFITEKKPRWGVEPICRVLPFAPASYYAATTRGPSARALRDARLKPDIERVWKENLAVYGPEKVWAQLNREGIRVGRSTVERLMRELGIRGVVRGPQKVQGMYGVTEVERPADLVKRQFHASAPNQLWVADLTYVRTVAGWVYVAFVIDVFARFVIGWQVSRTAHTEVALDALEMARWARRGSPLRGVIHHSDRGVQYLSAAYTDRLAQAGLVPSVGSRGDSYDNALAESFNGLYKTELIHRRTVWTDAAQVELATLKYIDWYNHRRLHGSLGLIPPAEAEATYHLLATTHPKVASH